MPLLKFHLLKGRTADEVALLLDAAHDAMVQSFGVPRDDRYQVVSEYQHPYMQACDTGLGIPRTEKFVLVEVISRPRGREAKVAFYQNLCSALADKCDVPASDVMVSFIENSDEDWSFGYGRAQFLTGEL
ncbi:MULTISPECIES: tautomerase family protein [unclassified Rhizobium]|uniref:tautomerase family protein n=1 Tax=unclassified Rhizobium TaxID=2613769 RepID=UPI000CDF3BDC|nr:MULTISPECIES: tautomerase family protein [Rhizobium]AVA24484.1 4-oxalocrotonate tautomerase protein [Rhizobium sp. NXC24]UWU24403.1 tautomerase family protein [Rhizobium tropici]